MTATSEELRLLNFGEIAGVQAYLADAIRTAGAVPKDAPDAASLRHVGIVGAGIMGRGIALAFASAGRDVTLIDPSSDALTAAQDHIARLTERQVSKGRVTAQVAEQIQARLRYSQDMTDLPPVDLVIEAVPEISELKQQVLRQACELCGPLTILASNTSTLDIDVIAVGSGALDQVIGTHFFIPAQVNKLLEIIPGKDTDPRVLAMMQALAKDLGKQSVVAGNSDGFIGNRLFDRFHQEAMYLVEEGATPAQIDQALEDWGMAIGPFRALDMVGNDIPWGVRKQRAIARPDIVQPRIGDALCEAGLFGQKTGKGWYLYEAESPRGREYGGAAGVFHAVSNELGQTRREIAPSEIVSRCVLALVREAWALLADGVAARGSDIDMVYVTGYGFPAIRGGPMAFAKAFGLTEALKLIEHFGETSGKRGSIWAVTDKMKQVAGITTIHERPHETV
jgi:3-hydroxyacyl-CoA dehydrogenase